MAASISSSIIACLKSFNDLIKELRHFEEATQVKIRGLVVGAWEDELGRLRMWAANIGAHQTGQSSLDFRLRDASHVREQIIKLLRSLLQRLQDARDVLADDEENDDGAFADDIMEEYPKTEIQELQESLATTINCLFQMAMLVRKPAQHDVHLGSSSADVAAFEPFDYNHVRDKFPRADDALVKRLSNAITRRRKHLRYRERHATKLRQGIERFDPGLRDFENVHEGETVKEGIASIISDTVATEFQSQNIDFDDNASDTGVSQTSYAPTLLSGGNITIPPPPQTSLGGVPFECPYCFYLITVHETRSWNKHVFQDLQPYICIAPRCTTPDKLYTSRHEWAHHSTMAHPEATTDQSIPRETKGTVMCSLCKAEVESGKQHDRHLALHLQELALFALPGSEQASDIQEDQDAESSSNAESAGALDDWSKLPDDIPASPAEHLPANENLPSSHSKQKWDKEEEQRLRKILTELEPEHPHTMTSMANLARICEAQGRYQEAEELHVQVLEKRKRVLGIEHPDTLTSMADQAWIYGVQGRSREAEELYIQVLEKRKRVLGIEHPDTLASMANLAWIYRAQGRSREAEELHAHVLETRKRVPPRRFVV